MRRVDTIVLLLASVLICGRLDAGMAWQVRPGPDNRVHAAEAFESVALSWSASVDLEVRLRASEDGIHWSDWIVASIDDDGTDRSEGRYLTAITHFGSAQRYLEISGGLPLARLSATMFPPQEPRRKVAAASLAIGQLTARSRIDWGCPDGEAAPLWRPAYTTVTHAVVHHTAGSNSVPDWEAEVRNIWYLHTHTNGWGDIGYNYLIDPNGVIYEGRAGGPGAIGAHFSCRNTNTAGIALLGTFTSGLPSESALDSLKRLLAELCARNRIDPAAFAYHVPSALNVPTIIGHRDGNASSLTCSRTECPGSALYALLPAIRSDVAAIRAAMPSRRRAVRRQESAPQKMPAALPSLLRLDSPF